MFKFLLVTALVGVVASKDCKMCQEMKLSGDGAEAMQAMAQAAGSVKCDAGKTVTCNEAAGEDTCLEISTKISMKGTGMDMLMEMTMAACGPSTATCDQMAGGMTKAFEGAGSNNMFKLKVESCDLKSDKDSGSVGVVAGSLLSLAVLFLQLF